MFRFKRRRYMLVRTPSKKREAIQKAYKNVAPDVEPLWEKDKDLLQWLKSF